MADTEAERIRDASIRKAYLTRWRGADHPDTIAAARELEAAHLARAMARARRGGLDDLDIASVAVTGQLAATAAAGTARCPG